MATLFEKLKEKLSENMRPSDPHDEIPDDETRNRYVKTLRRSVRKQMDNDEIRQLKRVLENYQRRREESWIRSPRNILNYNTKGYRIKKTKRRT